MTRPDVSVVVPTRNRSDRLPLALRSALCQSNVGVEVLVVDDGSTDDTFGAVSATGDSRVRYIRRDTSGGVSAARNDGIRSARADWIAFLDDDDVWAPTKLRRQLDALHAQRRRWAYAGEVLVDAELRIVAGRPPPPPEDVIERLARHNSVPAGASNVVVNGDVLSRVGGFDESLTSSEDWDLWIRLARDGRPAWVRDALVAVAIHPGGASRDVRAMLEQAAIVASRYGLPLDRVRHLRWAAWMSMLDGRRVDAAGYYVRAAAAGDARSLARAAAALAAPGFFTRTRAPGEQAGTTGAWLEEARAWVEALATP